MSEVLAQLEKKGLFGGLMEINSLCPQTVGSGTNTYVKQPDDKLIVVTSGMYKWPDTTGVVSLNKGTRLGGTSYCSGGMGSALAIYDISEVSNGETITYTGTNAYGNMTYVTFK